MAIYNDVPNFVLEAFAQTQAFSTLTGDIAMLIAGFRVAEENFGPENAKKIDTLTLAYVENPATLPDFETILANVDKMEKWVEEQDKLRVAIQEAINPFSLN